MGPFQGMANFLRGPQSSGLALNPVTQSVLAQQLLKQSMEPTQGVVSPYGVANKALLGLLQRRAAKAESEMRNTQEARQQALAGALSRTSSQDPYQAEAAKRAALIISGGLPQNPMAQAIMGAQAKSVFDPEAKGVAKPETDVGKINSDVRTGNISPEAGQALTQAVFKRDSVSIGNAEAALRKEFNQNLSGITTALTSLGNARDLLASNNPYGAQAALTAFVRAIDNSVVRPSEQEQYQGINGIAANLENRLGQLVGKGPFSEESKQQIMQAIEALAKTSEKIRRGAVDYYGRLAKSSGLDPYNVTGFTFAPEEQAQTPFAARPATAPPVVPSGPPTRVIR